MDRQKFIFNVLGKEHEVRVESFYAEESVSRPFSVNLNLVSSNQVDLDDIIGRSACLTIIGKEVDRFFNGIISSYTLSGGVDFYYCYQAILVPTLWLMGMNSNFRIFQNMSTEEIVKRIIEDNGIISDCFDFRLVSIYQKRRYCTQYGESDLRFISRILEEEGIFYYFEHTNNMNKIIFSDNNIMYEEIAGESKIYLHQDAGLIPEKEVIDTFNYNSSISPGKVTQKNFNFKRPSLDMTVVDTSETHSEYEIYEYPGDYRLPTEGKRRVKTRLQEIKAMEDTVQGTGNCPRFLPGFSFSFSGDDKRYYLTTVAHSGVQASASAEYSGIDGDYSYSNSFLAIPSSVVFRPERSLEKPSVRGIQTAIVAGPPGEEIYCDEYGRIKVQFHWDREEQRTEKNSCWLRISQTWSGQSWGMISIPRVGDEVLVAFINGDPDWPIVIGSVNNAGSPALYPLPESKTRSGIKTCSYPNGGRDNFHELRFEDKKGSEHIYLQSERDWNILVKNDKEQVVGRDETLLVKNDRTKRVEMNQSESIGIDKQIAVGANQTERIGANESRSVGANKTETVGANSAESVGLAKELSIGGLYQVSVGGIMNETVAGAKTEEVGLEKGVLVGADLTENIAGSRRTRVGNHYEISVGDSFQINCGSATFRLESDGTVFINGSRIELIASGILQATAEDIQLN